MKLSKSLAVALLTSTLPVGAVSQDEWLEITTNLNGSVYFIKNADAANSMNLFPKVWIKSDHSNAKAVKYRLAMELVQYDCGEQKSRSLSLSTYDAAGDLIQSHNSEGRWEYITPETVNFKIARAVCPAIK